MEFSRLIHCLCITIVAASYSHGYLLHMSASLKGLSQPHVAKRQTNQDVCLNVLSNEVCTNGFYEDYAYVATQCSESSTAQNLQDLCSRNSMGTICATVNEPDRFPIQRACDSSTTCSNQCRDLLNDVRNRLGCCVSVYNSTDYPQSIYRYSLWSMCNVEPITEQCTPSFPLHDFIPGACSTDYQQQLYSRVICRTEFLEATNDALQQTPGCNPFFNTQDLSFCAVDEQGRYCELSDLFLHVQLAQTACDNSENCNSTCIETLTDTISTAGCCFISTYNNTEVERWDWLSYDFWQECGLTSPGFCEQRFDNSPNRISGTSSGVKAFMTTIGFAAALVSVTLHY
jgi:hypothetical protein